MSLVYFVCFCFYAPVIGEHILIYMNDKYLFNANHVEIFIYRAFEFISVNSPMQII